jgi:hypothetical protein
MGGIGEKDVNSMTLNILLMYPSPVLDLESIYITVLQLVDIATSAHEHGNFALRDSTLDRLTLLKRTYGKQRRAC